MDTSVPSSGNTASPPSDHSSKPGRFNKYSKFNSKKSSKKGAGAASLAADDFKKQAAKNQADEEPVVDTKDKRMSKHQEKKLRKMTKKSKKKGGKGNEDESEDADSKNAVEEKTAETKDQTNANDEDNSTSEAQTSQSIDAKVENLDLNDKQQSPLPPGESIENIKAESEEKLASEGENNQQDSDEETPGGRAGLVENKFRHEAQKSIREQTQEATAPCSLQFYLAKFTLRELLGDKINCENCTRKLNAGGSTSSMSKFSLSRIMMHLNSSNSTKKAYTHATKQYLICDLPAILTIHLKRFQQHGRSLEKSNKFVDFPLILDMSPYTSRMCINRSGNDEPILYALYGLVEHSGKLNSGHYTACVRAMPSLSGANQAEGEEESTRAAMDNMNRFLSQQRLCHLNKMLKTWSSKQQGDSTDQHVSRNKTAELTTESGSSDKWFYVSDSSVSEISVAKVLKSQAYILFYQRIQ